MSGCTGRGEATGSREYTHTSPERPPKKERRAVCAVPVQYRCTAVLRSYLVELTARVVAVEEEGGSVSQLVCTMSAPRLSPLPPSPRMQVTLSPRPIRLPLADTQPAMGGRPLWEGGRGPVLYSTRGRSLGLLRSSSMPSCGQEVGSATPAAPRALKPEVDHLRRLLAANFTRAADVFRDIDANGSGFLSLTEFRRALLDDLGLADATAASDIDALFRTLDTDADGRLAYRELQRALRGGADVSLDSVLESTRRSASRVFATRRPNWSRRRVDGASGVVVHVASTSDLTLPPAGSRAMHRAPNVTTSASRRALPALVPSASAHTINPPARRPDEVVQDLLSQPTEAFLARTQESRVRRHVVPFSPMRMGHPNDVVPPAGVGFVAHISGDAGSGGAGVHYAKAARTASVKTDASSGARRTHAPLLERSVTGAARLRDYQDDAPREAAKFFGAMHFFGPETRVIPGVGILYAVDDERAQ